MDRKIVYPGAIPLETDILYTGKFAMVALARMMQDVLGSTGTVVSGFATTPTAPASMQVSVASGDVLSLQNVDGTAFGDVPADVSHAILKQGIALDPTLLTLTAPATSGQSIIYLVQVGYQDVDTDNVVLPYYNAASPSQPFTGPGGAGASQPTTRHGAAIVQAKAGIAATTGQQVAPAADTGFVGLFAVTVAAGQTTITSANIAQVTGAPFLAGLLNPHHGGVAGQAPKINLAAEVQGTLPLGNLPQSVQTAAAGQNSSVSGLQRDIAVLSLNYAKSRATETQLADGIADDYVDQTGVDTTSTTAAWAPTLYYYGPPSTSSPVMTSNTSPTGYTASASTTAAPPASGSGIAADAYFPYRGFDGTSASTPGFTYAWNATSANSGSEWLALAIPAARPLVSYTLTGFPSNNATFNLTGWYIEGYNGSSWVILDTQSGISWQPSEVKTFTLGSISPAYSSYRIRPTANAGAGFYAVSDLRYRFQATGNAAYIVRSVSFSAISAPSAGALWILAKGAQTITPNTDITAKLSRNGGGAYSNASLSVVSSFSGGVVLLEATGVDLTGQPSGTSMIYEVDCTGSYEIDILGAVYRWS